MEGLADLLATAPNALVVTDGDGVVTAANEQVAGILGYAPDDLVGRAFGDVVYGEDVAIDPAALVADSTAGPRHLGRDHDLLALAADGTEVPVELDLDAVEGTDRIVVAVGDASHGAAGSEPDEDAERYRQLVEVSPAPIAVYDREGVVRFANDAAADMLGHDDPAALVGTPALEFVHPDDRDASGDRIRHVLEERETVEGVDLRLRTADGETRHVVLSTAPVTHEGGPAGQVVLSDVTALTERERELARRNERLDELTSVVSHDLRNPLTVIQSSLALVAESADEEHVARCRRAVRRMDAIIDDMVALARVGEPPVETEPVPFERAARAAWAKVGTDEATLSVASTDEIVAEPDRLQELLATLYDNAVAHADPPVAVTVGVTDDGFYVADDGPGIPEDEREAVFRCGYSTAENATGFGLTIVEEIAAVHGWTVTVGESDSGGTRVEISGV